MGDQENRPLPRDDNMFRYLSPEPGPHELGIPADYKMPLELRTTTELIAEREKWVAETVQCPHCAGHGRVPKA